MTRDRQGGEADERLARLGREWFADARKQSAADDEEVKRFRLTFEPSRGGDGGGSDTATDACSDGADGSCGDGGGDGGGD